MEKTRKNKGITLVALVITIVILLILAGISIQAITNTGLFENAKKAAEESKYANAEEKVKMAVMASYDENASLNKNLLKDSLNKIDGINPQVTEVEWDLKVNVDGYEFTITEYGTVTCVGRKEQEKLPENNKDNPQDAGKEVALKDGWGEETTAVVKTSDGTEVTGLTKVSTVYAVSVGNGETIPVPKGFFYVGGTIDTGVIISDNETDKYDGKTDKTTHEYATKLKGNQFVWIPCTKDEYKKINFGMQNMASWDMETNTAEEEQISKYGGFYVGRYETSRWNSGSTTNKENSGDIIKSVAGAITMASTNWYDMYLRSSSGYSNNPYYNSTSVNCAMIWGCQYDATLNYILEGSDNTKVTQRTGNHSGTRSITGEYPNDIMNNIFDLSSNVREWTQEAYSSRYRTYRGGDYITGDTSTAVGRNNYGPIGTNGSIGSRLTLYLK